jgi:hypothetical protein
MARKNAEITLTDGTVVRHKASGYRGLIDGTTALQNCFTNKGLALTLPVITETFQYRIAVAGEKLRRVAPARDLEVVAVEKSTEVTCLSCQTVFLSRPGMLNKIGGKCECGSWICPACLVCAAPSAKASKGALAACTRQRNRIVKQQSNHKRKRAL